MCKRAHRVIHRMGLWWMQSCFGKRMWTGTCSDREKAESSPIGAGSLKEWSPVPFATAHCIQSQGLYLGVYLDAVPLRSRCTASVNLSTVLQCLTIRHRLTHILTRTLHSMVCPTCHNKFHSQCLSKWFQTSGEYPRILQCHIFETSFNRQEQVCDLPAAFFRISPLVRERVLLTYM
jgi:hypothetical protein